MPALGEGQILKNFSHSTWAGLMVSRKTPEDMVVRLNKALAEVLRDPEVRRQIAATGSEAPQPQTLAEAERKLREDTVKFRAMAKTFNSSRSKNRRLNPYRKLSQVRRPAARTGSSAWAA